MRVSTAERLMKGGRLCEMRILRILVHKSNLPSFIGTLLIQMSQKHSKQGLWCGFVFRFQSHRDNKCTVPTSHDTMLDGLP